MKGQYMTTIAKLIIWFAAEIILNLTGLDNMADYSEFIFGQEAALNSTAIVTIVIPFQAV